MTATQVFKESLKFTCQHFKVLLKLILIPLILSIGELYIWRVFKSSNKVSFSFLEFLVNLPIGAFCQSLWVPKWLQYYQDPKTKLKFFQFDSVQRKFFVYTIILSVICMPLALPLLFSEYLLSSNHILLYIIIYLGILAVLFLIFVRFEFIYPMIALSEDISLPSQRSIWVNIPKNFLLSWRQTGQRKKKLYCFNFLLLLFLGIALIIITGGRFLLSILLKGGENLDTSSGFVIVATLVFSAFYIGITKLYLAPQKEKP